MIKQCYTVAGKEVTAYIPKNTSYTALENLYDVCNELFADYSECFYTSEEVFRLKKDKNNIFLKG